jgi:hypothetical protein
LGERVVTIENWCGKMCLVKRIYFVMRNNQSA